MINKKKLSALLLSGAMLMSMNTPVFAQTAGDDGILQGGTEDAPVKLEITKDFQFAEGLDIPTVQFDFEAIKITADAPSATIASVNYSNADNKGQVSDGKYTVSKNAELTFDSEFPHAGIYEYTIKETLGGLTGIGYDTSEYKIKVHVANKTTMDGATYVKAIVAQDKDTNEKKTIKFVNTYTKNSNLIIEKQVEGDLGDLTKQFDFKITLKKSVSSTDSTFTGQITRVNGTTEQIQFTNDQEKSFKLAHGDRLEIQNLPVGTTYEVIEVGAEDGYTPKVTVIENSVKTVDNHGVNEKDDVSSKTTEKNNLVGEKENKVTFVNEYRDVSITGIITNNLPFILLIGLGVCGFGTLAILKRRKSV